MSYPKKRQLRDEWRRGHRQAPRREIGRTPNPVIQQRREQRRRNEEKYDDE